MASSITFKRRLDDMNNGALRHTLKRKNSYSKPTGRWRNVGESLLLGTFEKRMKIANASFFTPAARSAFSPFNHSGATSVGFHAPPGIQQVSHISGPSGIRSIRKTIITEVVTPVAAAHPGNVHGQLQIVPLDVSTVSESSRVKQLESLLRSERERGKAALDENADLRRKNTELQKFSLEVMESVERQHADDLKREWSLQTFTDKLELERYRNRVNALREPRSTGNRLQLAQDDEKGNIMGGSSSRDAGPPEYKKLWRDINDPAKVEKRSFLDREIAFSTSKLQALQLYRPGKSTAEKKSDVDPSLVDAFTPLSDEAEVAVDEALRGPDRYQVLVMHEASNIDVTRAVIQCLLPGTWLNDEVINVYMELLKEREVREPHRFLKCHFFNTFFYNKLFKDKRSYNYKAIRRWTAQKKLGYSLSECDKVLVPIHQDIHWCLAVINIRDKKLEYLDSLKGRDHDVLEVLAMYIADEVKDKEGKVLDMDSWEQEFPEEIPEQLNGCDCGMFMVKYADFHSRSAPLKFSQENMEYFRRKMVWEILQLKAT